MTTILSTLIPADVVINLNDLLKSFIDQYFKYGQILELTATWMVSDSRSRIVSILLSARQNVSSVFAKFAC